ncbi:MAG: hypothetical protein WCH34_10375 [Bacteroidota bacterium]
MKDLFEHIKTLLHDQVDQSPAPDLWDKIETELDIEKISPIYNDLPEYAPRFGLWKAIDFKLNLLRYTKWAITIIAVVSILLIYLLSNNSDNPTLKSLEIDPSPQSKPILKNDNSTVQENKSYSKNDINSSTIVLNVQTNQHEVTNVSLPIENKYEKDDTNINVGIAYRSPIKNYSEPTINNKKDNINSTEISTEKVKNGNSNKSKLDEAEALNISNNKNDIQNNNITATKDEPLNNKAVEVNKKNESLIGISIYNKDTLGIFPIKNSLPDTSTVKLNDYYSPNKKSLSIGIQYGYNFIQNKEGFSYKVLGNYSDIGIIGEYHYNSWLIETGVLYMKFNDKLIYNADIRKDLQTAFNYVDSIIYVYDSTSGSFIKDYITHQMVAHDTIFSTQNIDASREYHFLQIPIKIGFSWNYKSFSFKLKTGMLFSFFLNQKENLPLNYLSDAVLLKMYKPEGFAIRTFNYYALLSAEIEYRFYKNLSFSIGGDLKYAFEKNYFNMGSQINTPYFIGVNTALHYTF